MHELAATTATDMTLYSPIDDPDATRNGRIRILLCEGGCSRAYSSRDLIRLRAAGYRDEEIRLEVAKKMVYQEHKEVRRQFDRDTIGRGHYYVMYRCLSCGHERIYGVEEPELDHACLRQ